MLSIWTGLKICHLVILSQTANFDSSTLKEFADDNFKFIENGR